MWITKADNNLYQNQTLSHSLEFKVSKLSQTHIFLLQRNHSVFHFNSNQKTYLKMIDNLKVLFMMHQKLILVTTQVKCKLKWFTKILTMSILLLKRWKGNTYLLTNHYVKLRILIKKSSQSLQIFQKLSMTKHEKAFKSLIILKRALYSKSNH